MAKGPGLPPKNQRFKYPGDDRLRKGRQGGSWHWIRRVQKELIRRGYKGLKVDGVWGPSTRKAVRLFQSRRKGLTADGIPGPATWAKMFGPGTVPKGPSGGHPKWPYVVLKPGVRPAGPALMAKANAIGKIGWNRHGKRLVVQSGDRRCGTPSDPIWGGEFTQWQAWKRHQAKQGNLAAKPCTSNHGSGKALDCGWENKNGGGYQSFLVMPWARQLAKNHGCCFPVPGEKWHIQVGTLWRV